jgi:hypothetical protein
MPTVSPSPTPEKQSKYDDSPQTEFGVGCGNQYQIQSHGTSQKPNHAPEVFVIVVIGFRPGQVNAV